MLTAILAGIELGTKLAPTIITIVRSKSGGMTVIAYLDEADAGFDADLKQINDWQLAHGKVPTP